VNVRMANTGGVTGMESWRERKERKIPQ